MLRAYAHSAEDGSIIDLVEYPITIAPDRPPIILTSPACGQVYEVGSLILVTGTASLFEAALTVDVRDASGTTVATLQVTADECCMESNFSSRLTLPADIPPGLYDVVAYSLSAKDGSVENEFPVQIEVRGYVWRGCRGGAPARLVGHEQGTVPRRPINVMPLCDLSSGNDIARVVARLQRGRGVMRRAGSMPSASRERARRRACPCSGSAA